MPQDLLRILVLAAVAVAAGLVTGRLVLALMLASSLYAAWQHRNLVRLLRWLEDRKAHAAPDTPGLFEAICREVDYLRGRHKRRKRKLAAALKQFQEAMDALPDATVILGSGGEITWANRAAQELLGVRWPEDGGQRLVNLVRDPAIAALLAAHGAQGEGVEITSPVKAETFMSVRLVPYGEEQRLFVARDVTRLHRLNRVRSDFVANVSHELRTPLTVISGYIQALRGDEKRCPEGWREALAQVEGQAARMASVIDDLLVLSRLEQDDQPAVSAEIDVPELLNRIRDEAQTLGGQKRHMFILEIDPKLHLLGNESEIHSAFSNLVTNAVQYTPDRGVIRLRWYRDETGAHFAVEDNGIGIAPEHLPRLTERFYRVDPGRSRESGGTGLGLAIVKHVLNRHQAALHIESELGKGSLFRCDFPPQRALPPLAAEATRSA